MSKRGNLKLRSALIEALEGRAYLAGVVFGTPQNVSAAAAGISPVYANLDNIFSNTHADLIVASGASGGVANSVSVLPGNGDGTFGAAHTVPLTFSPLTIIDGLFGTNGKTGIAVGSTSSNTLGVILQATDGTLTETDYAATGLTNTQNVAVGDFNNDGHPDIAVSSYDNLASNNVAIFFNNGSGGFTLHQMLSVGHPHLASLTSFSAGGTVHLAVADQDTNAVTTIINDTNGNFAVGTDYAVGSGPVTIKSGQFNLNNNTNDDLVTANSTGGSVSVLIGNGDGTFSATAVTTAVAGVPAGGGPLKVRVSNVTNSGKPDLLALLPPGSTGDAEVLLGNGDGTFHVGNVIATGGASRTAIAGGDLNGDALTDVVVVDRNQVTALLNETNQDTTAPTAAVNITQPAQTAGAATITFSVTYADARQIDTTTLADGNVTVTDPNSATRVATFVGTRPANAASVTVTYSIPATGASLAASDDGTYHVIATSDTTQAVKNANGLPVAGGDIGTFAVQIAPNSSGPNLVAVSLTGKLPAAAVAGTKSKGNLTVLIKNTGTTTATGSIVIDLYASPDSTLRGSAPKLTTITKKINLKANAKPIKVTLKPFTWTASLDGSFFLIADVNSTGAIAETTAADNFAVSGTAVTVKAPFVDLANLWPGTLPAIVAGKKITLSVPLKNNGNVTAKGTATFTIQASGATTSTLATPAVKINIPVSTKAKTVKVPFTMPTIAAGTYNVILTLTFANDTNAADKSVTSTGTFTV
jgi:hypothetical protein